MFENILKLFSSNKATGTVAKDRLQVLLKMDRESTSAIPEDVMEKLREELMQVINKYLEIEQEELDVKFERNTDNEGRVSTALVANIPINKAKLKTEKKETDAKPKKAPEKVTKKETAKEEKTEK
ncbi:MAG: cell division topological specificity factor MinE [Clostridia bacterium]|nr:cell division topological specificity factor MinE [Clostridia bacterium]